MVRNHGSATITSSRLVTGLYWGVTRTLKRRWLNPPEPSHNQREGRPMSHRITQHTWPHSPSGIPRFRSIVASTILAWAFADFATAQSEPQRPEPPGQARASQSLDARNSPANRAGQPGAARPIYSSPRFGKWGRNEKALEEWERLDDPAPPSDAPADWLVWNTIEVDGKTVELKWEVLEALYGPEASNMADSEDDADSEDGSRNPENRRRQDKDRMGAIAAHARDLSKLPDGASRIQYLNALIENEKRSPSFIRSVAQQYYCQYPQQKARELHELLTATHPDRERTMRFLRETFANRTANEMRFFRRQYLEFHTRLMKVAGQPAAGNPPWNAEQILFDSVKNHFGERNTVPWMWADWLVQGFEPADTCNRIKWIMQGLPDLEIRSLSELSQQEKAIGIKWAAFALDMLECLSAENRTLCEEHWERARHPEGSLKVAVNRAVKTWSSRNTERLEKIFQSQAGAIPPPFLQLLVPLEGPNRLKADLPSGVLESNADFSR